MTYWMSLNKSRVSQKKQPGLLKNSTLTMNLILGSLKQKLQVEVDGEHLAEIRSQRPLFLCQHSLLSLVQQVVSLHKEV